MSAPKVEIFWREGCGFCTKVKNMFEERGIAYSEYNIWESDEARTQMGLRLPSAKTVPQVFVNGQHIGGCDETMTLKRSGALDEMLKKTG